MPEVTTESGLDTAGDAGELPVRNTNVPPEVTGLLVTASVRSTYSAGHVLFRAVADGIVNVFTVITSVSEV